MLKIPHQITLRPVPNVSRLARLFLTTVVPLVAASNIHAATINWGTPQTITTSAADVETQGFPVFAIDASREGDGTSTITVTGKNGAEVTFQSFDSENAAEHAHFSSKFRNMATFGGGSSDYGGIVDDGFWQGSESIDGETPDFSSDTVNLTGLTIGEEYLVQYWAQDARRHPGFLTVIDGSTNLQLDTDSAAYPDSGQYVVGTFVADSASQTFTVSGTLDGVNNYGRAQLNAIQLRRLAAPFIEWQPSVDMYAGSTVDTFVNNWGANSVLAYNATTTDGVIGQAHHHTEQRCFHQYRFGDTHFRLHRFRQWGAHSSNHLKRVGS